MANQTPIPDPVGEALLDFFNNKPVGELAVFSEQFDKDIMPVDTFFRNRDEMTSLEKKALKMARGRILDVGAGAGSHALYLQNKRCNVTAIDLSVGACEVMERRGVKNVLHTDFYTFNAPQKFDTLLLLMNGIGIAQNLKNLEKFFSQCNTLLADNGNIIFDSSDLIYLFDEDEEIPSDNYYGEISFQMEYKSCKGDAFNWLYIDPVTLDFHAQKSGFKLTVLEQDDHFGYLGLLNRHEYHPGVSNSH